MPVRAVAHGILQEDLPRGPSPDESMPIGTATLRVPLESHLQVQFVAMGIAPGKGLLAAVAQAQGLVVRMLTGTAIHRIILEGKRVGEMKVEVQAPPPWLRQCQEEEAILEVMTMITIMLPMTVMVPMTMAMQTTAMTTVSKEGGTMVLTAVTKEATRRVAAPGMSIAEIEDRKATVIKIRQDAIVAIIEES